MKRSGERDDRAPLDREIAAFDDVVCGSEHGFGLGGHPVLLNREVAAFNDRVFRLKNRFAFRRHLV